MKKLTICGVAIAALLLSSCATSKVEEAAAPEAPAPVFEGSWETVEFVKDGNAITGATATLNFEEPSYDVYGNSGVNNYFGKVEISDNNFKAGDHLGSTMMAGPEEEMAFETGYNAALTAANKIELADNELVISGDNSKITYTLNSDGEWETVEVINNGSVVTGAKATINFDTKYTVNGNAGVNNYFGDIAVHGTSFMAEDNFGATKKMGLPEVQAFEDAYLSVLPELNTITLENDVLTLSSDTAKLVFNKSTPKTEAKEEPAKSADSSDSVLLIEE